MLELLESYQKNIKKKLKASLGRLELPLPASEASALSTELQGRCAYFTMSLMSLF